MAEYGWDLSEDTRRKAYHELHEIPSQRRETIDAVKEQMETRPDIGLLVEKDAIDSCVNIYVIIMLT